jgi:2-hydroxy-3-keto-5-methylthiopentenyl-1-phosphate phosphatase
MIRIFTDFDGTITLNDVGDAMFERFGGARSVEAVRLYREGRLTAAECFIEECDACGEVDLNELNAFLDAQPVDLSFLEFVRFYRSEGIACYVVSDGMDYYIRRILDRCGAGDVPIFSNVLSLEPATTEGRVRLQPHFPYRDEVCDRCACCKRNHLLSMSGDDDVIVYVGEGYSDRCPVRFADCVFAKDELLRHCNEENISYHEYRTFEDVTLRLRRLMTAKPSGLRKRRRAELARRDVFAGG